jgi:hypothetical protein
VKGLTHQEADACETRRVAGPPVRSLQNNKSETLYERVTG